MFAVTVLASTAAFATAASLIQPLSAAADLQDGEADPLPLTVSEPAEQATKLDDALASAIAAAFKPIMPSQEGEQVSEPMAPAPAAQALSTVETAPPKEENWAAKQAAVVFSAVATSPDTKTDNHEQVHAAVRVNCAREPAFACDQMCTDAHTATHRYIIYARLRACPHPVGHHLPVQD
jgi:hypothetical protein